MASLALLAASCFAPSVPPDDWTCGVDSAVTGELATDIVGRWYWVEHSELGETHIGIEYFAEGNFKYVCHLNAVGEY